MKSRLLVLLALLSGCSLLPTKKDQSESLKTADKITAAQAQGFSRVVQGQAPVQPSYSVSGLWNRLEIPPGAIVAPVVQPSSVQLAPIPYSETVNYTNSGSQQVAASTAAASRYSVTIPLGVSIGLVGAGLMVLVWGVKALRSSSAAVDTAFQAADGVLAGSIRRLREHATLATDPVKIAETQTHIASLEADRGRLTKR